MRVLPALLGFLLLAAPAWAQPLSIPLTVQEPAGVARTADPITSGVPLPVGTPMTGWALFDGTRELALQVTPLRGRVPWILLDFQLDLAASQTKTLTLKQQTPMAAGPVLAPVLPPTTTQAILAGSTVPLVGTITTQGWETQGPLRSVYRVDGTYGAEPGFGFTTRYAFVKGKQAVRVEHVIRNSLQTSYRPLKLTSATITVGTGGPAARAGGKGTITTVPAASVVFEVLPVQQAGMRDPATKVPVTVADNGGFMLTDLTHYGATVILDPLNELGRVPGAANPTTQLIALAPSAWYGEHGELGARQVGSLEDERTMYRRLGWAWTVGQEPSYPHQPLYRINANDISIHSDSEGDDLWQNLAMLHRTGQGGYLDRARGWAHFYKWEMPYRTDGFLYGWDGSVERTRKIVRPFMQWPAETPNDLPYTRVIHDARADSHTQIGDHMWGWGLLDYYLLTGDVGAVEAAIDLGEQVETIWLWRTEYFALYGLRGSARNLALAVRLYDATGDARWKTLADHIVRLSLQSPWWREDWGMWGVRRTSPLVGWTLGPHHVNEFHAALMRYYERVTPDPEVKRRLIKIGHLRPGPCAAPEVAPFGEDHHPRWRRPGLDPVQRGHRRLDR